MPTYEQFRAMLPTWKHRLDDELEVQAQFMEQIASEVTTRNSRAIEAKDELARVEARLTEDYRDDDPKVTVGALAAKINRDPERIRAWQTYQAARSEHERWAGLLEAWRNKGYSIKTLADLYSAQYFSLTSVTGETTRIRVRSHEDQEQARSAMRVALRRPSPDPVVNEAKGSTPTRRKIVDD